MVVHLQHKGPILDGLDRHLHSLPLSPSLSSPPHSTAGSKKGRADGTPEADTTEKNERTMRRFQREREKIVAL
jgi:hypothetical protein